MSPTLLAEDDEVLARFRSCFPVAETRAYLFSGGLGPAARSVKAAVDNWTDRWAYDPLYHRARYFEDWEIVRGQLADLLGCSADAIALTDSTSRASNIAAGLLDLRPGGNVIVDATTYPSSLYPWYLPGRSVEVRRVASDRPQIEDFHPLVDDATIAISVSHVSAMTGYRHDLGALAELAHRHGAALVVDAAQSIGALPLDLATSGVDLLSGVSMKWLLGPPGIGFLYVSPALADRPAGHVGYVGTDLETNPDGSAQLVFRHGARRHELGIGNLAGLAGFRSALELVAGIGIARIERRIRRLTARCIDGLVARGVDVMTPREDERRAGVIAARFPRPEELARFLRLRGVDIWGYDSTGRIRIDPHGFNTDEDIDRLLAGLDEFGG